MTEHDIIVRIRIRAVHATDGRRRTAWLNVQAESWPGRDAMREPARAHLSCLNGGQPGDWIVIDIDPFCHCVPVQHEHQSGP